MLVVTKETTKTETRTNHPYSYSNITITKELTLIVKPYLGLVSKPWLTDWRKLITIVGFGNLRPQRYIFLCCYAIMSFIK